MKLKNILKERNGKHAAAKNTAQKGSDTDTDTGVDLCFILCVCMHTPLSLRQPVNSISFQI